VAHLIATSGWLNNSDLGGSFQAAYSVTLFTTPYTLLAGLYGMNVGNLPLALHPYGHLIILAIMSFSSLLIYVLLKYKKVL
jgi:Mg2+ and Co2+ transporter CorA